MSAMQVNPDPDGHGSKSFEVYADATVGGIRESTQSPDGMVSPADLEEAQRVLKVRLRQARRVEREQKAWRT